MSFNFNVSTNIDITKKNPKVYLFTETIKI